MYRIPVFEIRPDRDSLIMILLHYCINQQHPFIIITQMLAHAAMCEVGEQRLQSTIKLRVRHENLRYPVCVRNLAGTGDGIG